MIIRGIRVIDGTGAPPLLEALVQIKGSRINWFGPEADYPGDLNTEEILDGIGMTLMPGMINCHVHLPYNGESDPSFRKGLSAAEEAIRSTINAFRNLAGGVTTVRDCGNRTRAVRQLSLIIEEGKLLGPRIIYSGPALTITGGHGHVSSGREIDGVEEMLKAVREEIKYGAQWIKVIPTGGVLTPGTEIDFASYNLDELTIAVTEAKKFGRKVSAHAIGNTGIKLALRAGVHSIEHGSYLDDEAISMMLNNGVFHVPTLSAYHQVVTNGVNGGIPPDSVRKAASAQDSNTNSFLKSYAAGVPIATGTDAGTPFNYHGSIALELQLMVELGLSPLSVINIATQGSARLLGLENEIGTIEPGKEADLLLVYGNPLEDMKVMYNPAMVFKGGRQVPLGEKGLKSLVPNL